MNHSTNVTPMTGLYNMLTTTMLGSRSCWEGIRMWVEASSAWPIPTPTLLVWLTQEDIHSHLSFDSLKSNICTNSWPVKWWSQSIHPTDAAIDLKQRPPSGLLWVKFSFVCNSRGQSPPKFLMEVCQWNTTSTAEKTVHGHSLFFYLLAEHSV